MMQQGKTTLTQFIIQEQRKVPGASGDFSGLLNDIATACKAIANMVRRGPLDNPEAVATPGNIGNVIRKTSQDLLISSNEWSGHIAGVASTGMDVIYPVPERFPRGHYLLLIDPLDGSANLDWNIPVGTFFSIVHAPNPGNAPTAADFLQPGTKQVCAGYAMYGPTTTLVFSTGQGVNGFTLDREVGEFVLTHPNMRIPEETTEFAINVGNERLWEPPIKRYVDECVEGKAGVRGKDFTLRWIGSLVAGVHRLLVRGGVLLQPLDARNLAQGGTRKLLFEVNPVAFLMEQAGGRLTTGRNNALALPPQELQQRVPMIFGSRSEIERIERYHTEHDKGLDQEFRSPLFSKRNMLRNQ